MHDRVKNNIKWLNKLLEMTNTLDSINSRQKDYYIWRNSNRSHPKWNRKGKNEHSINNPWHDIEQPNQYTNNWSHRRKGKGEPEKKCWIKAKTSPNVMKTLNPHVKKRVNLADLRRVSLEAPLVMLVLACLQELRFQEGSYHSLNDKSVSLCLNCANNMAYGD